MFRHPEVLMYISLLFSKDVYRKTTVKASLSENTLNVEGGGRTFERGHGRGRPKSKGNQNQ